MEKTLSGYASLALVILSGGSLLALASGQPFVETALPGGMPVGNVLAAVALCSAAAASVGLSRAGSLLRRAATVTLAAAVAWLPVSVALAGNLALNFDGARGTAWLAMTLVTLLAAFGLLIWAGIDRIARRRRPDKSGLV